MYPPCKSHAPCGLSGPTIFSTLSHKSHNLKRKKISYLLEWSPSWEVNRFSVSQEFPRILWNPKVHYRIYKSPPPVPVPSQVDPVSAPSTSHFLKIHLNIILPSMPGSSKWLFLQFSPPKPCIHPCSSHTCYMPRPSHSSHFEHRNNLGEKYRSLRRKKLQNIKCGIWFSLQLSSETFLIPRWIQWVINVCRSSCKLSVIIVRF